MTVLLVGLALCIGIGAIGVAIIRGVPPGSFLLGALIWLVGVVFIAVGFSGAVFFLFAMASQVLS